MNKPRKNSLTVSAGLALHQQGSTFVSGNRIELLEQIEQLGSITQAAKAVGLSYKGAWDAVDTMNNMAEKPLLIRATGGSRGGGSRLTEYGRQIVQLYRQVESGKNQVLARMQAELHDVDRLSNMLKVITMKTSARNQFFGKVKRVRTGAVNADVILDVGEGLEIFANITNAAVRELGLKPGSTATALIKSSLVLLSPDADVRISARNKLTGTISAITAGSVNSEVKLSLAGGRTLVAIITAASVKELGLRKGQTCTALIKASHVLIAVND
jgi:molybdate transport system regulatory protein